MLAQKFTPQEATDNLISAEAKLARENEALAKLERTRARIETELTEIESERKSLAVAALSGKSDAKIRAAQLAVRRNELTDELELIETAIPEIQERLQPFIQACEEAQVAVFEAKMETAGTRLKNAGATVDNHMTALVAALLDHFRAIEELEALGANRSPVLTRQNRLIEEVISRARGREPLDAAIANVPLLPGLLNRPVQVHAASIKSLETSMAELADSHLRRR